MDKMDQILHQYTAGEKTLEETNQALREAGANVYLDPKKNELTEAEKLATTVGDSPDQVNGWGLLDTGTGTLDKVQVKAGKLVNCDCGGMYALVLIAGRQYEVRGSALVDR